MTWNKIFEFPILYDGWECDNVGWIEENEKGERRILLTSHNAKYVGTIEELEDKIAEYNEAIRETEKALSMLS